MSTTSSGTFLQYQNRLGLLHVTVRLPQHYYIALLYRLHAI